MFQMIPSALDSLLNGLSAQIELPSKWNGWPFNSGYGGDWQTSLATFAFSGLILGAICIFLRLLYGPRGIWRDHEMDREAEEMRRKELAQLESARRAGRVSEAQYARRKRELEQ